MNMQNLVTTNQQLMRRVMLQENEIEKLRKEVIALKEIRERLYEHNEKLLTKLEQQK